MKRLIIVMMTCFLQVSVFAQTTDKAVEKHMNFLASDVLQGRDVGTEGIAKAASYIEKYFKKNHVEPYFKSYKDTLGNLRELAYNIVGVVPGTDDKLKEEYIVIGAHYDHIGFQDEKNGDDIANGANDNASGTTAVLEFAKYFGIHKSNKRSLIFVLFSAEEKGLLGSEHLAEKFKDEKLNLVAMLNFEMIGVPMEKEYATYLTGYNMSNAAKVINETAGSNLTGFLPEAEQYGLFKRSDNFYFYSLLNIPAHTICSFDFSNYQYYHDVADEVSEIDVAHMTKVINAYVPVLEELANTNEFLIKLR